ncbi:MAG: hypothetical protein ACJ8FL_06055 [Sphingomicrobium sp.]
MKRILKTADHRVRSPRRHAGKTLAGRIKATRPRPPFDAVAYAAALEVLG